MSITRMNNTSGEFDGYAYAFEQSLPPFPRPSDTSDSTTARIDWKETSEAPVFKVDLPGNKKEEVKVEVEEGNVLQICGERTRENEDKTDCHCAMENGVLTVTVPKEEVKKPEVKSIDISG